MPSTTGRNPVQSFRNAVDSLKAIAERLRNVCIENLDYQECVRRYDSKDTLFYRDPPYLGVEHYYGNTFTQDDHRILAELLHDIKGHVMSRITRIAYTMGYTRAGIGTSISHSREVTKRRLEVKSLLRWNAFILILNL